MYIVQQIFTNETAFDAYLFSDVQLTGINQDMVDGKPHIEEVLQVQ
jgi:hypothetical protein